MTLYLVKDAGNNGDKDMLLVRADDEQQALNLVKIFYKNPASTDAATICHISEAGPARVILVC